MPGFPIRTPWDHSSVDSSPRPIAASHVLHRLLVPRHPPSALHNFNNNKRPSQTPKRAQPNQHTQKTKMLASTMHISTNNQPPPTPPNTYPSPKAQRFAGCGVIGTENPSRCCLFFQDLTGCSVTDMPSATPRAPTSPPPFHTPKGSTRQQTNQNTALPVSPPNRAPRHHTRVTRAPQ